MTLIKEKGINLITLGDTGVGKTCMINRFIGGTFTDQYNSSIGSGLFHKKVIIDSKNVDLKIWDTAGQEKYDCITEIYFQRANGAFIVFDLTSRNSFQKAQKWINSLKKKGNGYTRMVLIGNKSDLEEARAISDEEARLMAYNNDNIPYFETSAKTGFNIDESFMCLAKEALNTINKPSEEEEEEEKPQPQPFPNCKC